MLRRIGFIRLAVFSLLALGLLAFATLAVRTDSSSEPAPAATPEPTWDPDCIYYIGPLEPLDFNGSSQPTEWTCAEWE